MTIQSPIWEYDGISTDSYINTELYDFIARNATNSSKCFLQHAQYVMGPHKHTEAWFGIYSKACEILPDRLRFSRQKSDGVSPDSRKKLITHCDLYPYSGMTGRDLFTGHWGRFLSLNATYGINTNFCFPNVLAWFHKVPVNWWGILVQIGAFPDYDDPKTPDINEADATGVPNLALYLIKDTESSLTFRLDIRGDSRKAHTKNLQTDKRIFVPAKIEEVNLMQLQLRSTYNEDGFCTGMINDTIIDIKNVHTSYNNNPVGSGKEQHNGALAFGMYTYGLPDDDTPISVDFKRFKLWKAG